MVVYATAFWSILLNSSLFYLSSSSRASHCQMIFLQATPGKFYFFPFTGNSRKLEGVRSWASWNKPSSWQDYCEVSAAGPWCHSRWQLSPTLLALRTQTPYSCKRILWDSSENSQVTWADRDLRQPQSWRSSSTDKSWRPAAAKTPPFLATFFPASLATQF